MARRGLITPAGFYPPNTATRSAPRCGCPVQSTVWGTGVQGALFRYSGGHWEDWIFQHSGIPFDLADLWGTSAANIYAVGQRGSILHYNGSAWVPETSIPTLQRLNAAWGSSASDIFAVGDLGTIVHYNGSAWICDELGGVYAPVRCVG